MKKKLIAYVVALVLINITGAYFLNNIDNTVKQDAALASVNGSNIDNANYRNIKVVTMIGFYSWAVANALLFIYGGISVFNYYRKK